MFRGVTTAYDVVDSASKLPSNDPSLLDRITPKTPEGEVDFEAIGRMLAMSIGTVEERTALIQTLAANFMSDVKASPFLLLLRGIQGTSLEKFINSFIGGPNVQG